MLDLPAALVRQAIARRLTCRAQPRGGAEQGAKTSAPWQDERREFTALVRYLFPRHGVQMPVPAELLAQVEHRLLDLQEGCLVRPRNGPIP